MLMALFKLIDKKLRVIFFAYKHIIKCEIITDFFIWHMAKYGRMITVSLLKNHNLKSKFQKEICMPTTGANWEYATISPTR